MPDRPEFNEATMQDGIDVVCSRFEVSLRKNRNPRIEEYLGETVDLDRRTLLEKLLTLEVSHRMQQGDIPHQSDYATRFPESNDLLSIVFANVEMPETVELMQPAAADTIPMPHGTIDPDATICAGHHCRFVTTVRSAVWRIRTRSRDCPRRHGAWCIRLARRN